MSSANDICLHFSYIYDKLQKVQFEDLTQTLQGIKIQLELIQVLIDEVHLVPELECIFAWAKFCRQYFFIECAENLQDAKLLDEITKILLEILVSISKSLDQQYFPENAYCIANECGNIITFEDEFMNLMEDTQQVNFNDYIDVKSSVTNSKIVFYRMHNVIKGLTTKTVLQNKSHYFQRFSVHLTVGNFEFANDKEFQFYPPTHKILEENLRKLLILQFVKMPFESSPQLEEFLKTPKLIELMRRKVSD